MNKTTSPEIIDERLRERIISKAEKLFLETNFLVDNDPDELYNQSKLLSDELAPYIGEDLHDEKLIKIYLKLISRLVRIIMRTYKVKESLDLNSILHIVASLPDKKKYQLEILDIKASIVSYFLSKGEHKKAVEAGEEIIDEVMSIQQNELSFSLLNNIGHSYWLSSNNAQALRYFRNAIAVAKNIKYSIEHYKPYNNAANILLSTGVMTEALDYFLKALKIANDFEDSFAKSIIYLNLGIYYYDLNDLGKTLEYYQKSLDERKRTTNKTGLSQTLGNFASLYLQTGKIEKAYEYAQKSFEAAKETKSKIELMTAYTSIAYAEIKLGKKTKAKESLMIAFNLSEETNSLFGKHQVLVALADLVKNNFDDCLEYSLLAYNAAKEIDDKRLIAESCYHLSNLYEENGDFQKALEYYKEKCEVKELIRSEVYQNKTAILQSDFDFKQAKQKAEFLATQNEKLSNLNAELQKLNSDKSDFLNIAAHDLRNPISSIISNCDFILSNYTDKHLPLEVKDMLEDINTSSENMIELINKLLDINKIEEGNFGVIKENFDFISLLNEISTSFYKAFEEKGQQILVNSFGSILNVYSDKNIIKQILINLISNASKYSPLGSEIIIKVIQESSRIVISVKDSGPGFPNYMKGDVFKKFSGFANKPTGGESSKVPDFQLSKN